MASKIIKNTSLYTIGNILPKAAGFILLPIYTRYLTPADYGIVSLMQVLSTILTVFFTMAIDKSIYRLYFDYKIEKDKRDYLGTITISLFLISLSVLLVLFIFRGLVGQLYKSIDFYPFYFYAILTTFFSVFSIIPKIYFQVNEKAGKFVFISILQFLLSTGFVLWFVIGKQDGAAGMLEGRMLANIVILPIFVYILYRTINFTFKLQILKESLAFSLPMIPSVLSSWILDFSDRIFIERYFSLLDVGIYSLGYKIAELVLVFTSAFFVAYSPVFYKLANSEKQIEVKKRLSKYNSSFVLIILVMAFLISLFSKEAITLLLDPRYIEAYKIVPFISLAYFISQTSGLIFFSITQEKKTLQIMYMILGSAILNIILNFLLVPSMGVFGAAYATILSFATCFIAGYWYAKRCYFIPIKWKQIVPCFFLLATITILFQFVFKINIYISLLLKILIVCILLFIFTRKYYNQFKSVFVDKDLVI